MNFSYVFALIALAMAACMGQAQTTLNSLPQGVLTLTLPSTASGAITSFLSLPLTPPPSYVGVVSTVTASGSVGTDTISVALAPGSWAPNSLAQLNFVKFLSGQEKGRVVLIESNSTTSLTLDTTDHSTETTNLSTANFTVNAGDAFEVFAADTLASLFGDGSTNNPLLLQGGTFLFGPGVDNVGIYNPDLGKWQTYFFNTSSSVNAWVQGSSTASANNTLVYPYASFKITRGSGHSTALNLPIVGRIPEVPILTKSPGSGATVHVSSGYPVDLYLSNLDLGPTWLTSAQNNSLAPFVSDTVQLWNTNLTRYVSYYQYKPQGATTYSWREAGDPTDVQDGNAAAIIHAGDVLSLHQVTNVSGAGTFVPSAMPYTVDTNSF